METVNVRIPGEQLKTVRREVDELQYPSFSEYVREALRRMVESRSDLADETVASIRAARRQRSVSHSRVKKMLDL